MNLIVFKCKKFKFKKSKEIWTNQKRFKEKFELRFKENFKYRF